jgi:Tfp pilus assembly protein PilV
MTGTRGTSVMEALVGAALAGLALAGLAATAQVSAQALRLARNQGMALAVATERLEALRAGPRGAGTDAVVTPDGTTFRRTWRVRDGRGAPATLDVDVAWGTHALALGSEVWP